MNNDTKQSNSYFVKYSNSYNYHCLPFYYFSNGMKYIEAYATCIFNSDVSVYFVFATKQRNYQWTVFEQSILSMTDWNAIRDKSSLKCLAFYVPNFKQ